MSKPTDNTSDTTSLNCLQKALDETQETIRAFDAKSEVLAIILTLLIGIVNFNLFGEGAKVHYWVKFISIFATFLGLSALCAVGMVLWPHKNISKEIKIGTEKPEGTYFVSLDKTPEFGNLDEYLRHVDATDWKREVAYELLKTSCIRDIKHYWFHIALRLAVATLLNIVGILEVIAYYG